MGATVSQWQDPVSRVSGERYRFRVPSTSTLLLFFPAALVLLIIPGPSVLYIVTRSIDQGRRAGFISVLGTHFGSLVHVAGAALGLSALIVTSALAFSAVKCGVPRVVGSPSLACR